MADESPTFTMTSSNNIAIARMSCTLRRARLEICGDDAAVGAILNTKVTTKRSGQAALDVVNYDSNGSAMDRRGQNDRRGRYDR